MRIAKTTTGNVPLLEVKNLKKYFPVKKGVFAKISGWIKAVDDISFTINKGRPLAWWESRAAGRARRPS